MVEDIGPEPCASAIRKKLIPPLQRRADRNEADVHLFERLAFMAQEEAADAADA